MSEIKVGDRVKVEFEGVVEQTAYKDVAYVRDRDRRAWLSVDRLTVIPQPIVLPNKRNALIELEGDIWLLGEYEWLSPDGASTWTAEGIAKFLRTRPKANYRVIFAGEGDE